MLLENICYFTIAIDLIFEMKMLLYIIFAIYLYINLEIACFS